MKFSCAVVINLPVNTVIQLWTDEDSFFQWQDGFSKREILEGEKNKPGVKTRIIYYPGKGQLELLETLLENDLPKVKKNLYVHSDMVYIQTIKMNEITHKKTELISEIEYKKFIGLFPKLLARLFPSMFKKQALKWLNDFKTYAEIEGLQFN